MKNKNTLFTLALLAAAVPLFAQAQNQQPAQPAQPNQQAQAQPNQQANQQGTIPPDNARDGANMAVVPNDPEAEKVGLSKVADENLQTILIDDFEVPQGWQSSIPLDYGISRVLYRDGSPQAIATENNKMVLGVKTIFFRRNYGWMSVDRPFPLTIRNVVKNFSLWVVGRGRNHVLSIKVRDIANNMLRVKAGTGEMRWQGWKKVIVPVLNPVVQSNPIYSRQGLDVFGFHIDLVAQDINVDEPTYFYFDYMTATVNFAGSQVRDDMTDNW